MLLKVAEFAKSTGKTRQTVYKAIKEGRIEYAEGKLIDTESTAAINFAQSTMHQNKPRPKNTESSKFSDLDRAELENERLRQQIIKLELENSIKTKENMPRKLVKEKYLLPLEDLFIRLIADSPRTILLKIKECMGAKMSDGEIERQLKLLMEAQIKRTKQALKKGLNA